MNNKFLNLIALVFLFIARSYSQHGYSVWQDLKYPRDFSNFDYVNPNANKGGVLSTGTIGTFDSINPFIVSGTPCSIVRIFCFATLFKESEDTVAQSYSYLAESINVKENYVEFNLRKNATFSNSEPINADDVIFSFNVLITDGLPLYKSYYSAVEKVKKVDDYTVRFFIKFDQKFNKELPLILGQIPIFSKKYYSNKDFKKSTLEPFVCSGPYTIEKVNAGRSVTFKRIKNWWGENIPSCKGMYNVDTFKIEYFRDSNACFEAFKSGALDFRIETSSRIWNTSYNFPAFEEGKVKKTTLFNNLGRGTTGFFINTRKPYLQDKNLRKAICMVFHFNFINKTLFYNEYKRCASYFCDTSLAVKNTQSEILGYDPNKQIPRKIIEKSISLLKEAGWSINQKNQLEKKGEIFPDLELIIFSPDVQKAALNLQQNLKKIGISLKIKLLDFSAYQERLSKYDYDLVYETIMQSLNIGNEQKGYFGSASADKVGGYNYSGIKDLEIDKIIDEIILAKSYEELSSMAKKMDQILLDGYYMIQGWCSKGTNLAYWDKVKLPSINPIYNHLNIPALWVEEKPSEAEVKKINVVKSDQDNKIGWYKKVLNFIGF